MTLKQLLHKFFTSPGGFIVGATLLTIVCRLFSFPITWKDFWIAICIIGAWPILEYIFHRYLMHEWLWSPFNFTHERHHNTPTPETGLPDTWVIGLYYVLSYSLLYTTSGLYTAYTVILCMLLWYEFAHYACHTTYQSKTWWGFAIRANHLQHHQNRPHRYSLLFPFIKVKP